MSRVILENIETGETKEAPGAGTLEKGWRIKGVIVEHTRKPPAWEAKIAVWSVKLGLPTADFLDAARWLLQKDCPFCQLGTQVLREIDRLGEHRAKRILENILIAKQNGNLQELEEIRKELWSSETPASPPQF